MIISVLKVIGIILLVLLCIIIFILGFVLFVPIRYKFDGAYFEKANGNVEISWFPMLFKAQLSCRNNEISYTIRLFGGIIMTNTGEKLSFIGRKFFAFEETEDKEAEDKEPVRKYSEQTKEASISDAETHTHTIKTKESETKSQESKRKKQSVFEKIKNKIIGIRKKIHVWIIKLKEINNKKEDLLRVYHSKRFELAKKDVKVYMKYFLKIMKPKHIEGRVHFGMEDPAATGEILGALAVFLPLYDSFLKIEPDFEQSIVEGTLKGFGQFRIFSVVKLALKVIFNKNLMKVIKKVKRIMER